MSVEQFFDEIVANATIDVDSPEIQDVTSALEEFLYRYARYIEDLDPQFKLAYIHRAGSMAEKTALWKSERNKNQEIKYIEFDYLVVLDDEDYKPIECEPCKACVKLRTKKGNKERLVRGYTFNRIFHNKLHSNIAFLCSCSENEPQGEESTGKSGPVRFRSIKETAHPCEKCNTVVRDTGFLELATKSIDKDELENFRYRAEYSLAFYWTSATKSLVAPDVKTLQKTERISRLLIHVDYLLAFEIDTAHIGDKCSLKRFIVPKRCPVHLYPTLWRLSYSTSEVDTIRNRISDAHRKCYIVLKYIVSQFGYWTGLEEFLSGYYTKVAFLNHCESCANGQAGKDSYICITEILLTLQNAYKLHSLKSPFSDVDLLAGLKTKNDGYYAVIFFLLHIISEIRLCLESDCKAWCRHSAKRCIQVAKKTAQEMRGGHLWLDTANESVCLKRESTFEVLPEERRMVLQSTERNSRISGIYRDLSRAEKLNLFDVPDSYKSFYMSPAVLCRIWYILEKVSATKLEDIEEADARNLVEKYQKSLTFRAQSSNKRLFQTVFEKVHGRTTGCDSAIDIPCDECDCSGSDEDSSPLGVCDEGGQGQSESLPDLL